jgi:hypothetical protein
MYFDCLSCHKSAAQTGEHKINIRNSEDGCLLGCSSVTDVSEVPTVSIIRAMMKAARTSATLVNFYQTTRRYNPEDSHILTRRRESLKSYIRNSNYKIRLKILPVDDYMSVKGATKYKGKIIMRPSVPDSFVDYEQ